MVGRMSRNGSKNMNGQGTRSRGTDPRDSKDERIARLEAQNQRLRLQRAEMEAITIVNELETKERIRFGRDQAGSERVRAKLIEEFKLAILHDEDMKDRGTPDSYVADKIDEIRQCYARREQDEQGRRPVPQSTGVARYARNPTNEAAVAERGQSGAEDFEPANDEQVCEMADLMYSKKMSKPEAMKYMRKRYYGV